LDDFFRQSAQRKKWTCREQACRMWALLMVNSILDDQKRSVRKIRDEPVLPAGRLFYQLGAMGYRQCLVAMWPHLNFRALSKSICGPTIFTRHLFNAHDFDYDWTAYSAVGNHQCPRCCIATTADAAVHGVHSAPVDHSFNRLAPPLDFHNNFWTP